MDQNKKTMRHFYCRDVLWETFEQMANDFDCSIDYLINEAMRSYARSKNYQSPQTSGPVANAPPPRENAREPMREHARDSTRDTGRDAGREPAREPSPHPRDVEPTPAAVPAVRLPTRPPAPPQPSASAERRPTSPPAPPRPPQPARATAPPVAAAPGSGSPLFLVFNSQRFAIDKDQFIIGRGSKTSDLPIKDGNISRKHAAVIRRNGVFYIKDLGSTNGIDYKGMRIDNKRIDEGDVFHICDYELKFTYRG